MGLKTCQHAVRPQVHVSRDEKLNPGNTIERCQTTNMHLQQQILRFIVPETVKNARGDYCCYITVGLLPQRVKNSPIVPDPEQLIRGCYPVRVGVLGIPKDGVREPNQANHIADGEKESA